MVNKDFVKVSCDDMEIIVRLMAQEIESLGRVYKCNRDKIEKMEAENKRLVECITGLAQKYDVRDIKVEVIADV